MITTRLVDCSQFQSDRDVDIVIVIIASSIT